MRRAKGEGTGFKQANGLYCAKLPPERRADGTSFTPSFRGKTRQLALDKRSAYLAAKTKGRVAAKGKGKEALLAYLLAWVETHPLADGTRKAYRGHINNHIGPWFGDTIRLSAVTTDLVRDFIEYYLGKKPGVSKATVERIRATLSKAMNCAVMTRTIQFNPVHLAKAPKPPAVRMMLARATTRAGIDKRIHPHGLRHTMAREMAL
jgi:site-specific recombinase XerD